MSSICLAASGGTRLSGSRGPDRVAAWWEVATTNVPLLVEAGGFHRLVERLAFAVHEDRVHADVVEKDDIGEQIGQGLLVVHNRSADLDDDDLVVEALDVAQRFDEGSGLGDG